MPKEIQDLNELYEKLIKEIEDLNGKLPEIKKREDIAAEEYNTALDKEQKITKEINKLLEKRNNLFDKILRIVVTIPLSIFPVATVLLLICSIYLSSSLVANLNIDIIPKTIIGILGGVTSTGLFAYITYHFGISLFDKTVYKLKNKINNLKRFKKIQALEEKEEIAKEERTNKHVKLQEIYKERNECNENIRLRRKFLEYLDEELNTRSLNTSSYDSIQIEKGHPKVRNLSLEKNN